MGVVLEDVPVFVVYKRGGELHADFTDDCVSHYELLGFLKCFISVLFGELKEGFEPKGKGEF